MFWTLLTVQTVTSQNCAGPATTNAASRSVHVIHIPLHTNNLRLWQANSRSAGRENTPLLLNQNVHYSVHNRWQLVEFNPLTITVLFSMFFNVCPHLCLCLPSGLFTSSFPTKVIRVRHRRSFYVFQRHTTLWTYSALCIRTQILPHSRFRDLLDRHIDKVAVRSLKIYAEGADLGNTTFEPRSWI